MALKIFLSLSITIKWQLTLRQAWTTIPSRNQGRCKQKSHNKKKQCNERVVNKKLCICGCSAIKNYVADLNGGLNEQLEKEKILLPISSPRTVASHELRVFCHHVEKNIINGNVDTNRIKLRHMPNGEGGRKHS